jgi:hypothetical protein
MNFESLIRYKTLHESYTARNSEMVDHLLRDPKVAEQAGLKKLQFDVSLDRFNEVESICAMLSMSKREFLDAAVAEAVAKAHEIIAEVGYPGEEH